MHKILLTLFILAVLFFPKSEAFATAGEIGQECRQIPKCESSDLRLDLRVNKCLPQTCKGTDCPQTEPTLTIDPVRSCNLNLHPSSNDVNDCRCRSVPIGAALSTPYQCKVGREDLAYCDKSTEKQHIQDGNCYCIDENIPADKIEDAIKGATFSETCKTDPATGKSNCTSAKAAPCPDGLPGILTAIGCVPTEPKALVEGLLKYGTLAAGGIAFLIMILAALQMITAEGNPEAIKGAQEKFYSAIIGLLLIVFAVLLMQVIGVDILGLPELGAKPPAFDTSKGDSS